MADEQEKKINAPVMSRSRSQLATAYAPGAFFTFEGGLGACIARPDAGAEYEPARIPESAKKQIVIRLAEISRSWFARAINCRPGDKYQPHPRMCVDDVLLRDGQVEPLDRSRIEFVNPIKMGYAPAPLTFVCNTCGLFRGFKSVKEMENHISKFKPGNCQNPKQKGNCQWRQLDVIFVHWSGHWEQARPGMYEWNDKANNVSPPREYCSQCFRDDFLLDTKTSPHSIGRWFFECAHCGHRPRDTWLQNDPVTTDILRSDAGLRNTERRMEAISYRASAAFYPQYEQFVVFEEDDEELLSYLDPTRQEDLKNFIAKQYGFGATRPTLEEMKVLLEQAGKGNKWYRYEEKRKALQQAKLFLGQKSDPTMRDWLLSQVSTFEREIAEIVDSWFEEGDLHETNELPPALYAKLQARADFSTRYDPFTLAVEHAALKKNKLDADSDSITQRRAFVRFTKLDPHLAPKDAVEKGEIEEETRHRLDQLGIEEMGLIREFNLCRFTYGYTRVQAVPSFEKRHQMMPVRLNLFPSLENNKKPVYAVTQANEAIYVRLKSEEVYRWLQAIEVRDEFEWSPNNRESLGARLLERAVPFGRFLANLRSDGPASSYLYAYTLLHTYSHVLMKAIAEHSGLDLGSLGEYVFPADLAFVVYRNGTTMDLGNLSSLWRNNNIRFLAHLLEPKTLLCNSGSICDQLSRGACPDCIMIPETSCIAANQLLSRAVLRGGEAPREDGTHRGQRIRGYLEVLNESIT